MIQPECSVACGNMHLDEFAAWAQADAATQLSEALIAGSVPTVDELLSMGFLPVTYDGQDGTFYRRDTTVETMPYASAHLIDGECVVGTSIASTEVTPCGRVQMVVFESDLDHEEYPVGSAKAQTLIKDAAAGKADMRLMPQQQPAQC